MRFCFDLSSTAFSPRCVFDEKAYSISVDRRPKNIIMESLSFTCTTNVKFKLRISGNRKSADKNDSKQFLWIKKLREATNLSVQIMNSKTTSKGETWSRGINLRFSRSLTSLVYASLNETYGRGRIEVGAGLAVTMF